MLNAAIRRISGRAPSPVNLPAGTYRHSVRIEQLIPFLTRLSPENLAEFYWRATFSVDCRNRDERSAIIPLTVPLIINGRKILALRLKGIYPQTADNRLVLPYTKGKGYPPYLVELKGKNTVSVRRERTAEEYTPWGTMELAGLEQEVSAALLLGPERTDLLLGFGLYDQLVFNGQPVGFAIYGMETREDERILFSWRDHAERNGVLPEAEVLAEHTGELSRDMHERIALLHRFLHLANYRRLSQNEARILDLDSAVSLLSVPVEFRAALIYLDLARTISDYMKVIYYREAVDDNRAVPLTPLLPFFLWGYFRGDTRIPFVRKIEKFVEGRADIMELYTTFGLLPEHSDGWIISDPDDFYNRFFSLIEPYRRLSQLPGGGKLNLKHPRFMSKPVYASFFQAIEAAAS